LALNTETAMKAWKCAFLALSGGVLLQAGSCATDFGYLIMQALATQLAAALLSGATGSA